MRTLQEHLDDLDRMVDSGKAPAHQVRSQIAFIAREVAALEAAYAGLDQAHAQLQQAHARLQHAQPHKTIAPPPDDQHPLPGAHFG